MTVAMAIGEHVLVEKGFAFVATRGPLSDVSISFHGAEPFIVTGVEASISQLEDRTLVENDDAEMSCAKKKRRDAPHAHCSHGCPRFELKGSCCLIPCPHKRSR